MSLDAGCEVVPPPPIGLGQCRFGQWYLGAGQTRYGGLIEYQEIGAVHEAIHELAGKLIECEKNGDQSAVRQGIDDLKALREEISRLLFGLQMAMSNSLYHRSRNNFV